MLEHGGRLDRAIARYGQPRAAWLDLSTGINPSGYPVPPIPPECWQRLPEPDPALLAHAAAYYGSEALLPVAGSQAAIQALPGLIPGARVGVLTPTYNEHAHAWQGRDPQWLPADRIEAAVDRLDVLVLVNPNNPTGARFGRQRLLDWHARLAARGGTLVVDEAFADAEPADSLAGDTGTPGLVVLRSLGKFFGLAGARVGFVLGPAALRETLAARLGPWTLAGPAQLIARHALADRVWQAAMRAQLAGEAERLARLLATHGAPGCTGTALFRYLACPDAARWQAHLARRAIWVRRFDTPAALRLGLPGEPAGWQRLDAALAEGRRAGLRLTQGPTP